MSEMFCHYPSSVFCVPRRISERTSGVCSNHVYLHLAACAISRRGVGAARGAKQQSNLLARVPAVRVLHNVAAPGGRRPAALAAGREVKCSRALRERIPPRHGYFGPGYAPDREDYIKLE